MLCCVHIILLWFFGHNCLSNLYSYQNTAQLPFLQMQDNKSLSKKTKGLLVGWDVGRVGGVVLRREFIKGDKERW